MDWKLHSLVLVLTLVAELIGKWKFNFGILAFSLFPMLYVLIFGCILGGMKLIPQKMMEESSSYITISVTLVTAKVGSSIGPNLPALVKAGPALILQEFGNLGTALLALPIAVLIFHMGRVSIGACFSIARETALAVVGSKYGLESDEGLGVLGAYITGTVLGTMFFGILPSLLCSIGIFHPFALAMACGTGSSSMMSAGLASIVSFYPDLEAELSSYAAASNVLSTVDGLYMAIFISIPMCELLYKKLAKNNRHYKNGEPISKITAAKEDKQV
ncbi:MAG: DUF3100 domain-containing protein [Clostridium sp.]|nr:DUF3100 domain-containing protein [Clostridium sp.]